MSGIIIFKWYSPKKITQYLLLLGLAAGLMPIEKTQAASSVQLVQQQTVNVKGTVLDSHGEPVIGANVVVDNTTQGTITDIDGNFKLSVPMGAKLKISFIGYETQTVVVKNAKMSIVLADDSNVLDEVQIVAYGAQKKVTVTGAVSGVKGSDLLKTPTGSVTNVLSGQLTGITTVQYSGEPGADVAEIFVRGQGTWNNSAPLIQVDGVERTFNEIDPNEIESITVLKDASATAVFGVRGANGVVLITTRRGTEGKA
ncbi:carboxypeptidase-like regulatory domain-containing protein, partial [Bacteroides sp.]|uniref:carboxypeptidase-like regulatory domain-containing protein n=1 Tax=Bacteroides sp. TaxID=29523 RepID=UPI0039C156D6